MIKMVRKPSETPNITNIDDIVPFRYAYGNNDGFVKGKGSELSCTIDGSKFRINSGRVVLHGVESEIDANGESIQIDTINETRYYSVYYNVNLATNTTSILSTYDTAGYPVIDKGEDLTANSSGYANLELYRFIAINGVISEVSKVVQEIPYPLTSYDISKGTVEERLTKLGFKEGSIELSSTITATENILTRQGNYVLGRLKGISGLISGSIGTIPEIFRPKQTEKIGVVGTCRTQSSVYTISGASAITTVSGSFYGSIDESGSIFVYAPSDSDAEMVLSNMSGTITEIYFGYEAKPIN